jgi:hypothetical protein
MEKYKSRYQKMQKQKEMSQFKGQQNSGNMKTNMTSQSGYMEMNFSKYPNKDNYSFSKMKDEFDIKKIGAERTNTLTRKDFADKMSEGTQKTKQSKKSGRSNKSSLKSETDIAAGGRDKFEEEKTVQMYAQDKKIESLEQDFEYKSDEESIFNSFVNEVNKHPQEISKNFTISSESNLNKKLVKDVMRRFVEKTQTFEFMIEFDSLVEKTDESSITAVQSYVTGEVVD